jgi:ABC-type sulfate transport system substrate-binding protein
MSRCSTPARAGSTVTFVERNVGDVLIAWENEAFLSINEFGKENSRLSSRRLHPGGAAGRGG